MRDIKFLCRGCAAETIEKVGGLGHSEQLAFDKNGFCEKCGVDTGHLIVLEILNQSPTQERSSKQ